MVHTDTYCSCKRLDGYCEMELIKVSSSVKKFYTFVKSLRPISEKSRLQTGNNTV